ncbi:MAG: hypothetical protein HOQ12_10585 [Gemmatimonadaceae bacterium]|nr:hypothetical protein [Gemmatimonadaceae bacterium]NUQ92494.1 hypothetical protein [Gemmatimonadaceae bacterium]NUR19966.1 hypothetical protein [Gemmatimonadaceae bacterium]
MQIRHLAAAFLVFTASAAAAQAPQAAPKARNVVPTLGFSIGAASLDPDAAASSSVGDQAWGIQLDGGVVVKKRFLLGVDVGGQFLDDKAQFTQSTTGGDMKSSASVTYFSAMAGLRSGIPASFPIGLAVNVGASATVGRRSIDNCVDCHTDKLKIPGGGFVEPTLLLRVRKFMIRATDRVYLGGDGMRSVISAGMQFDFHGR